MHFPRLRYLQVRNAAMNAPQLKELITSHRETVKEYDFESVVLVNNGNWEEALSPLDRDEAWSRSSLTTSSEYSLVSNESSEDLPSPSAAVEAASRELLDVDLGGLGFSDEERSIIEGLSEEVASAREETLSVNTNLKRRRVRRRRRRPDNTTAVEELEHPLFRAESHSSYPPPPRHKPSRPYLERSQTSFTSEPQRPQTPLPNPTITAPLLKSDPYPVLLQPTVYDPTTRHKTHAPPSEEGISSVQRNYEQEEAHRRLAEDATARTSALRKAKEAVLMKLSREFCNMSRKNSLHRPAEAVSACRFMAGREFGGCGVEVVEDRRALESRSALVPLMFARA